MVCLVALRLGFLRGVGCCWDLVVETGGGLEEGCMGVLAGDLLGPVLTHLLNS